ncbi:hypothetical protein ACWEQ3_46175 [Streptomyces mirabilis]
MSSATRPWPWLWQHYGKLTGTAADSPHGWHVSTAMSPAAGSAQ